MPSTYPTGKRRHATGQDGRRRRRSHRRVGVQRRVSRERRGQYRLHHADHQSGRESVGSGPGGRRPSRRRGARQSGRAGNDHGTIGGGHDHDRRAQGQRGAEARQRPARDAETTMGCGGADRRRIVGAVDRQLVAAPPVLRQARLVTGQAEGVPAERAGRVTGGEAVGDAEAPDRSGGGDGPDRGRERGQRARAPHQPDAVGVQAGADPGAGVDRAKAVQVDPAGAAVRLQRQHDTAPTAVRGGAQHPQPGGGSQRCRGGQVGHGCASRRRTHGGAVWGRDDQEARAVGGACLCRKGRREHGQPHRHHRAPPSHTPLLSKQPEHPWTPVLSATCAAERLILHSCLSGYKKLVCLQDETGTGGVTRIRLSPGKATFPVTRWLVDQ